MKPEKLHLVQTTKFIYSLNNEENNIVLKGNGGIFLYLKSANDTVEVLGKSKWIYSEGGNNTIISETTENLFLSLQGNGDDTLILNASLLYGASYLNFGGGMTLLKVVNQ